MQQSIIEKVEAIREAVIGDRRSFHQYPELGWMEIRTAALVAEKLEVLGFELKIGREVLIAEDRMGLPKASELEAAYARALDQGASPLYIEGLKDGFTALVGILGCGEGPTIAMRFDMDALPVTEAHEPGHHPFDAGFASVNLGVMHACGHDGHTAMGLGVARVIASLKEHLKGTFKLIFQPAEEGVRGAKAMAHSGVLDDVDYLIGAHIGIEADSSGTLHTGMHGFYATSKMDIRFKGIPSHAGIHPEGGKNALLAAATASLQMHAIPRHSDGVTRINVGKLEAGSGRNVIPEDALMLVETRGGNSFLNNYMVDQVTHIVKHVAALYSVDYSIDTVGYAENASSDEKLMAVATKAARQVKTIRHVIEASAPFSGSEDFTYMMNRVQAQGGEATYILIGSDIAAPHHNGHFDFKEEDLLTGVKLLALMAYELTCI